MSVAEFPRSPRLVDKAGLARLRALALLAAASGTILAVILM